MNCVLKERQDIPPGGPQDPGMPHWEEVCVLYGWFPRVLRIKVTGEAQGHGSGMTTDYQPKHMGLK